MQPTKTRATGAITIAAPSCSAPGKVLATVAHVRVPTSNPNEMPNARTTIALMNFGAALDISNLAPVHPLDARNASRFYLTETASALTFGRFARRTTTVENQT